MADSRIKAIDTASVHRIHSGQVVLDLQGAVKELVENSIDAGATSVDVRIKDHGLESVEVSDNGSGIEQADWASIGLKHHTSKLPSLEQLAQVLTFGFRGEALASLCALCESVTVTTATKDTAPMGAVITLGRDGRVLDDTGRVARQRGTTITLTGLFRPLPVRRKEFERTAKREFTKALGMLTAYALVPACASPAEGRSGVRLRVEIIGAGRGGKRSTVLSTDGRGSLRSSVTAVWTHKALEGVVDLDIELDVEVDKAMARREGIDETSQTVRVRGLISSGAWGQGRSSTDRQFTYINGRPCVLPKVLKAVNEVYKSFNTNQHPLAILDFEIPRESVDINVSPDKRTIFVHSEANLIEALKSALETFFQPTRSTYAVHGASSTVKLLQNEADEEAEEALEAEAEPEPEAEAEAETDAEAEEGEADDAHEEPMTVAELASEPESDGESEVEPERPPPASSRTSLRMASVWNTASPASTRTRVVQQTLDTTVASWSQRSPRTQPAARARAANSPAPAVTRAPASGRQARSDLRNRLAGYASQQVDLAAEESDAESEEPQPEDEDEDEDEDELMDEVVVVEEHEVVVVEERRPTRRKLTSPPSPTVAPAEEALEIPSSPVSPPNRQPPVAEAPSPTSNPDEILLDPDTDTVMEDSLQPIPNDVAHMDVDEPAARGFRDEIQYSGATGEATLQFDMARLRKRMAARRARRSDRPTRTQNAFSTLSNGAVTKAAGVQNRDADEAEAALARVICKDDFNRMEVLGQFNKGFIIARLRHARADDLFIVDQHASDEKYNFETLQRTTVIKAQALIKPRRMELTAADEIVAMENMDVLHANGFDVDVDEDAAPGRGERIRLRAMPISKETTFDFKDLEQLLHLLSDSARPAGQMVRCTKARAMFAMRACRRSVMIGKSLTKAQMVALLRNMGTIDQPWNCPHGRPTMRHLCSLTQLAPSRADRIDWSLYN